MKNAYPVVMTQGKEFIVVYVPDFNINTQGTDFANVIEMARDAIGLMGIDMEDENEALPKPSAISEVKVENANDIVTLVDVDFSEYRRKAECFRCLDANVIPRADCSAVESFDHALT